MSAEAAAALETAGEAIDTADKAMDFYNKVLDQVIPWKTFEETLDELDKFRDDYSNESAALLGEIKTHMLNGMDAYFRSSQSIYEWCGLVTPLLKTYITLFKEFNAAKSAAQKTLLLKVLDDGIQKMTKSQEELASSSLSFNKAAGQLTALHVRFENEFDEKSEYFNTKVNQLRAEAYGGAAFVGLFGLAIAAGVVEGKLIPELIAKMESIKKFYQNLKEKVDKAFTDIDDTKNKLKNEIRAIGDLKTQTEETKTYVSIDDLEDIRDVVIESANNLIAKCDTYRKRHGKQE